MHISWSELMDTPAEVLSQDIEMLSIENDILKWKGTTNYGRPIGTED